MSTNNVDRIRRASTRNEFERAIDDFVTQGYTVESRGQHAAQLKEPKGWGSFGTHFLLFLFTFWTFGFANVAYAIYYHKQGETVLVKHEPTQKNPEATFQTAEA